MANSRDTAARILIAYESFLPFGRRATLPERLEAMRKAVELLGIEEGEGDRPPLNIITP